MSAAAERLLTALLALTLLLASVRPGPAGRRCECGPDGGCVSACCETTEVPSCCSGGGEADRVTRARPGCTCGHHDVVNRAALRLFLEPVAVRVHAAVPLHDVDLTPAIAPRGRQPEVETPPPRG